MSLSTYWCASILSPGARYNETKQNRFGLEGLGEEASKGMGGGSGRKTNLGTQSGRSVQFDSPVVLILCAVVDRIKSV